MPVASGTRLGPYEILSSIGAGGMGEVYKARDTRLGRDVAVKVSHDQFSERFQLEARAVAALNHPNICTLHDVGPNYLVMELIDGAPLKGPLPLDQALRFAAQICGALGAAHKRGITHRDLKPANILVTKVGIKLLDFGLAKFDQSIKPPSDATLTMALTGRNEIVGTIYYMSPEQLQAQATGQEIDARSDIFSFGLVLYEMITGKRAFEGSSPASVIAAIMERPAPSIAQVAPPALDRLLQRCLAKDPEERWQTARDLKGELEWIANTPAIEATSNPTPSQSRLGWVLAAIATLAALALGAMLWAPWRPGPDPPKVVRFQIAPPEGATLGTTFALSPDGSKLAFYATGSDGVSRLWLRTMDALESHALPGTEGNGVNPFFWSPDSRFILYNADNRKLKKVDVTGGPPLTICDAPNVVISGSANRDGVIIFGLNLGTIQRVPSAGGTPLPVTALNTMRKDSAHGYPVFLPDGRHFLYFVRAAPENTGIYLASLDSRPEQQAPKLLVATSFGPGFVPFPDRDGGAILFDRDGTLLAQPFDLRRLEPVGEAVPIMEQLGGFLGFGFFSASRNGTLVYRTNKAGNQRLGWLDRQGKSLGAVGDPHSYRDLALSPDGTRVAAVRTETSNLDIWLTAFPRAEDSRLTFDLARDQTPVWSPDGKRIAFASDRTGNFDLYQHASNGAGQDELLFKSDHQKYPTDWSRDGRYLLYIDLDPKTKPDLWVLPMDSASSERKPVLFLRTDLYEGNGKFSPDVHWIGYESTESGRVEVYVQPFPAAEGGSGKWMVSHGGGTQPHWRGDGKELFYLALDGAVMAVPVSTSGAAFEAGTPAVLFKGPPNRGWDVSADGKKFLFPIPSGDTAQAPFTVVQNWTSLLKK
jgi:serine/threonine protein kinase/Tol biopolymer transport system component